jgi:hypothetical protein
MLRALPRGGHQKGVTYTYSAKQSENIRRKEKRHQEKGRKVTEEKTRQTACCGKADFSSLACMV